MQEENDQQMRLIIITGFSGSGKSVALHTLEDRGYYCIDNLPVFLLPAFADEISSRREARFFRTAVGIDARNPSSDLRSIESMLAPLKARHLKYEIVFLEAHDDTLIKRFSETRRKHPLSGDNRPLAEAITLERQLLKPFLHAADLCLDTTHTTVHQLRQIISERLGSRPAGTMSLLFLSFGFKYGVPRDADYVFDARVLPNPHWDPALRPLTGQDQAVAEFLNGNERVKRFRGEVIGFLDEWIGHFEGDGRNYLTVAIGCTGGQHRSVYLAEQMAGHFRDNGRAALVRHRELS